ncbi:MAG TPA: dihydrodipicolinate synthase family protein [Alphaproteobacteria bacterium]|nr:dihydrodipicolinate synthase family protein [Alphaproteobacteria bacterium]
MPRIDVRAALGGISGVHVTPYDADGNVDAALLRVIVDRIAAAGIHAIVSAGNTGEFYALTDDEVRAVHDGAIAANAGRALLIASVGRALRDAIPMARRAAANGADAILVHQPLDPFAAPHAQADYFIAVAEAVDLPVLAYLRSDALGVDDLIRVASHPNIAGVKVATQNLMRLAECIRMSGPETARWICGLAEGWAPAFYAIGARGFTSGLVNVVPERSLAIHAALEAGDFDAARRLVSEIAAFEAMRTRFNNGANVTVVKAALRLSGYTVGEVRLPGLPRLDDRAMAELATILKGWGLEPR